MLTSGLGNLSPELSMPDSPVAHDNADSRQSDLASYDARGTETEANKTEGNETGLQEAVADAEPPVTEAQQTARDFFRGAQAGTCLHGIFEYWDFHTEAAAPEATQASRLQVKSEPLSVAVAHQLQQSGYALEPWQSGVESWFKQVVKYPLIHDFGQCRLVDIDPQKRLDELEFCLPLGDLTHPNINPLIMQGDLNFAPTSGYLKGFIDLIFEHQGRYFVLDYKSNQLGDRPSAYHQSAMAAAMASHHYDAQAWIYTLALDQFLAARLPNYDPEQHLGGVFYCFIRAMVDTPMVEGSATGPQGSPQEQPPESAPPGVYYIAPDHEQLQAWRRALLPCSVRTQVEVTES